MSSFLKTSLLGKINNLPSFKGEALLPVFEAVANSIQAIEERGSLPQGEITVQIDRDTQPQFDGMESEIGKIVGFEITDNGIGFDETNYDSFLTAETTHKLKKGGKGIGRFFWLKAFSNIQIESVYEHDGEKMVRRFRFSKENGISDEVHAKIILPQKTTVKLIGFKEEYRKQPSAYKTTDKIAQRILEHCLSYFISNTAPHIIVRDNEETILLNDLYEKIKKNIKSENILVSEQNLTISHIKLYSTYNKMHNLVFCANSREVKSLNISKLLGTSIQFDESGEKFIYSAYVSGAYLDKHVESSRLEFNIPEKDDPLLIQEFPLSMHRMTSEIINRAKEFLATYLDEVLKRKQQIATQYVAERNPTLRAVLTYCPEVL